MLNKYMSTFVLPERAVTHLYIVSEATSDRNICIYTPCPKSHESNRVKITNLLFSRTCQDHPLIHWNYGYQRKNLPSRLFFLIFSDSAI